MPYKMSPMLIVVINLVMATFCQEIRNCKPEIVCRKEMKCEPNTPGCPQYPVDIALLIDSSASIGNERNFTIGLKFIKDFLDKFDIRSNVTRVAAVMYGDRVYTESAFNFKKYSNKKGVMDAITNLKWMGGNWTDTGAGIQYMVDKFFPEMPQVYRNARVGIVITDGQSQDKDATRYAAIRARNRGIYMIAIGIGKLAPRKIQPLNGDLDMQELKDITGTKELVIIEGDYSKLKMITDNLTRKVCHYALEFRQARTFFDGRKKHGKAN